MSGKDTVEILRVMPREMRMMTERIFSLTQLPKGFVLAVADVVMLSQKLGLGGFTLLEQRFDQLRTADPARMAIVSERASALTLDARGEHAWFAAFAAVDLLGESTARGGAAQVTVVNATDPAELGVVVPLAAQAGLSAAYAAGNEFVLTAASKPITGDISADEPLLWELLEHGAAIEADLWWRVYHLAQKALTPDSVVSRRHAGPLIVNDDGTVIGRKDNDDETDLGFLTSIGTNEPHRESAG